MTSQRQLAGSPPPTDREVGFSLVEVLAALAISTMLAVAAFQILGVVTAVAAQRAQMTAARDLAGVLLAEGVTGQGATRGLRWQAVLEPLSPRLVRRTIRFSAPRGPVLSVVQFLSPDGHP